MALRHGVPTAPGWVTVLEAAAEWSRPPWDIAGGQSLKWWMRWNVYRAAKIKIQQENERKWQKKSKS